MSLSSGRWCRCPGDVSLRAGWRGLRPERGGDPPVHSLYFSPLLQGPWLPAAPLPMPPGSAWCRSLGAFPASCLLFLAQSGPSFWFHHLLLVYPWKSEFTSLGLSFLFEKWDWGFGRISWNGPSEVMVLLIEPTVSFLSFLPSHFPQGRSLCLIHT